MVHAVIGQPLTPGDVARFSERELVAEIERRIRDCHAQARQHRAVSRGADRRAVIDRADETLTGSPTG